ncbi:MAG: S8 family serine peptidase [Armatimonadota bacterium]|nr:S8 family serine peptidase [Armatimonadota bacterium]
MSAHIAQELKARGVAEVIVVLKATTEPEVISAARAARGARLKAALAPAAAAAKALARYFVSSEMSLAAAVSDVDVPPPRAAARRKAARRGARRVPPVRYFEHLGVMLGTVTRAGLAALRADPRVRAVTGTPPLSLVRPPRVAAARLAARRTWGIEAMNIPALWQQGLTGRGVLVGHLDTGVDGRHPVLRGAIATFAEFDALGRERRPAPRPYDTDDHGTHTAATIAGRPVNGRAVGVAPGAHLASAIVIEGGDVVARVLGGMDWAVAQGVRILNMSLGFRGWWEDFRPVTRLLRARNILPVFAVGNEGPGTSRSPGNYSEALSVGAFDEDGAVADFSSSQRFRRLRDPIVPDLVAPGVNVISARPGGRYLAMDGTSMATPHIAGLAALLLQAKPDATETRVERAILRSCSRRPWMDRARAGRGVPDAAQALAILVSER